MQIIKISNLTTGWDLFLLNLEKENQIIHSNKQPTSKRCNMYEINILNRAFWCEILQLPAHRWILFAGFFGFS